MVNALLDILVPERVLISHRITATPPLHNGDGACGCINSSETSDL